MARLDTRRDRTAKIRKRAAKTGSQVSPRSARMRGITAEHVGSPLAATREAIAPRLETALGATKAAVSPRLETAKDKIRGDLLPKVAETATAAMVASGPVRDEAKTRGQAAMAAVRGDLTAKDMRKMKQRRRRRKQRGKRAGTVRRVAFMAGLVGAAATLWNRWRKHTSKPDWNADAFNSVGTSSTEAATATTPTATPPTWAAAGETLANEPTTGVTPGSAAGASDLAGANPEELMTNAADAADALNERPGRIHPRR